MIATTEILGPDKYTESFDNWPSSILIYFYIVWK